MRSLIWTLQWLLYNYVFFELHWCGSLASIKKQIWNLRCCGYKENIESCGHDSVISVSCDLLGNHNRWTESLGLLKQEERRIILQGAMRNKETALCFTPLSFQLILDQPLGLCVLETVTAEDYQYWDKQKEAYKRDSCSNVAEPSYFSDLCTVCSVFPTVFIYWWASNWCLYQN